MNAVIPIPAQASVPVAGGGSYPVRRIYCVGRNFAEHAREMGAEVPRGAPVFFMKPADAVHTDADGRATDLVPAAEWGPGRWRLVFDTAAHLGADAFLPSVTIEFALFGHEHHHVPLLLSPFGFSTYRGT